MLSNKFFLGRQLSVYSEYVFNLLRSFGKLREKLKIAQTYCVLFGNKNLTSVKACTLQESIAIYQ